MNKVKKVTIITSVHPDFDARIWKHATSLSEKGLHVTLICPWEERADFDNRGVEIVRFERVEKRWLRSFLVPYRVLRLLFPRLSSSDVVHFHDIDILPYMALVSIWNYVVYDVHENYAEEMLVRAWVPEFLRKPLYYAVFHGERLFSRLIGNVVLVAESQEKVFGDLPLRKHYIRNYATVKLFHDVRDDYMVRDPAVIFTGTQHKNNGSMLLLEIAERVRKKQRDIVFYASDRFRSPQFREAFMRKRRELGLDDHVILLPNVAPDKIMDVLNRATVAISPNLRVPQQIMGVHTKLYEYMAASLPMVVSDLPHQQSLIQEGGCGILARPEEPESFVEAIMYLIEHPDEAWEMGQRGQKLMKEKYSWEAQMDGLLMFYQEGLSKG